MPALQILPPNPSFGSQLGQALGGGVSQGLSQALSQHFEMKQKQAQTNQLLEALGISPQQAGQQGAEIPSQGQPATRTQQALGQTAPQAQGLDLTPEKVLAATMINPQVGSALGGIFQAQQRERTGMEKEFLKSNLSSFKESQGKLPEIRNTDLRLKRLGKLSESGELPGPLFAKLNITEGGKVRFPALFSKEGQEFVKLITDSAKGAKDSFGARVTNFELDTFLQSLPSLLQTPEGRNAVLRDLDIMNQMNRLHNQAVVDVSKQAGFRVDPAQFESMVQEKIGPQIQQLSQQFIQPESIQGTKQLSLPVMQEFLKKAKGATQQEKIANAKKLAQESGYQVE